MSFIGIAFELRFRFQALLLPALYAVSCPLVPRVCGAFYPALPLLRCTVVGALKVLVRGVVLPLVCCRYLEARTRRLFSALHAG